MGRGEEDVAILLYIRRQDRMRDPSMFSSVSSSNHVCLVLLSSFSSLVQQACLLESQSRVPEAFGEGRSGDAQRGRDGKARLALALAGQ